MSISNFPGGKVSKTTTAPTGPYNDGVASGVWTLEQAAYWQKQGLWPISGNIDPSKFIENIFSTHLYTGTGAALTITNGIDLSTKGGLVWLKTRSDTNSNHTWGDTARGTGSYIYTNTSGAADTAVSTFVTAFNTTGFSLGSGSGVNQSSKLWNSWTFRKQPKFFDIVTYTGTGSARTVAHNLGSVPGFIIVKSTSNARNWCTYHRSLGNGNQIILNGAAAFETSAIWNSTTPTSSVFSLGTDLDVNGNGLTYVAYLFAHDAGGFGLSGSDNVISCGGYTGAGSSGIDINLGYEPQWVMIRRTDVGNQWMVMDNMRGLGTAYDNALCANTTTTEAGDVSVSGAFQPTATGFRMANGNSAVNASGGTYIYIAIRRGPMAVPTSATSVFTPSTRAGTGGTATTSNLTFPIDMIWTKGRDNGGTNSGAFDRIRGPAGQLSLNQSDTQTTASTSLTGFDTMTGYKAGADAVQLTINATGYNYVNWQFRRAPGFFDIVGYTGTGSATTFNHNLGVAPEMMIFKSRSLGSGWKYYTPAGGASKASKALDHTSGALADNGTYLNEVAPTSSVFTVGGAGGGTNNSTETYVAYLFATLAGVSKVGSYTGTGATQTIDCGFTAGSRFVMIKRTDTTGDWYIWDSARGIIPSNDPYLLLNSTAAEVTNTDYVDTSTTGFDLSSTAPAALNANGGTYIFLAIA